MCAECPRGAAVRGEMLLYKSQFVRGDHDRRQIRDEGDSACLATLHWLARLTRAIMLAARVPR